ncbi:hypothetical protein Mpsy_0556 [Methanolobus psychrophilus R15]|nr:hypothetical protein Mpsy_0556 [Methanolobus psychrophilus R15]
MPSDFAGEKALAVHNKAHRENHGALPMRYPMTKMTPTVKFLAGA